LHVKRLTKVVLSFDMVKRPLSGWVLIFLATLPLSWFFAGPIELSKKFERLGLSIPAGDGLELEVGSLPDWWRRFDLKLWCEAGRDCGSLRVALGPNDEGQGPIRRRKSDCSFRLHRQEAPVRGLFLRNPTDGTLAIQKCRIANYSAINTSYPRFTVLLSPHASPAYPATAALLLALVAATVPVAGLFLSRRQDFPRWTDWRLWIHPAVAWTILAGATVLRLHGEQLMLSWEAVMVIGLSGSLLVFLASPIFRKKLFVPAIMLLIAMTIGTLVATDLGIGLPVARFGPTLIYEAQFTETARYAGLTYACLAFLLYLRRADWFLPAKHALRSSLLLVLFPALLVYLANGYTAYGGDTTFNSVIPTRIVRGEGLLFSKDYVASHGSRWLIPAGDAFLPLFPVGSAFLGLPTAWIQHLFDPLPMERAVAWNQKVTAALVASLSAAFLFQALYVCSRKFATSLLLAAGFAFGTTQVTISAAGLWQHGPAVLLISAGLFLLVKGDHEQPAWLPLAALPMAFLPLVRTQAIVFYLAALASVGMLRPRSLSRFLLWSVPGIFLTLWVNVGLYQSLLGGYSYQASADEFSTPLLEGLVGSLLSLNRGLFAFSPFLVLGVVGAWILVSRRSVIALCFTPAAALFLLIHAKYHHWHGGACVAPRFSSELVPILALFSASWFTEERRRWVRWLGGLLVLASIAINLPGSFFIHEQSQWNVFPDVDLVRSRRVWDYRDWLPVHFRHRLRLEGFKETAAYAFAGAEPLQAVRSTEWHYRVKVPLTQAPVEVLRMDNIRIKEGRYRILFHGASSEAWDARVGLTLHFLGRKIEEITLPVARDASFALAHAFEAETGYVDIRLMASGRGSVMFDTIQILPQH
jgi:hypothetical protein